MPDASLCLPDEAVALNDPVSAVEGLMGIHQAFLDACRAELSVTEVEIANGSVQVVETDGKLVGIVHVVAEKPGCVARKAVCRSAYLRSGIGRTLYEWAIARARSVGASAIVIASDPSAAAPLSKKMGAMMQEIASGVHRWPSDPAAARASVESRPQSGDPSRWPLRRNSSLGRSARKLSLATDETGG